MGLKAKFEQAIRDTHSCRGTFFDLDFSSNCGAAVIVTNLERQYGYRSDGGFARGAATGRGNATIGTALASGYRRFADLFP